MVGIDVKGLADWITRAGILGTVLFFLVGFQQRWWIFPRELDAANAAWEKRVDELVRDRDEWKQRCLVAIASGERMGRVTTVIPLPGASPS